MSKTDHDIEALLRSLPLRRPSVALDPRVVTPGSEPTEQRQGRAWRWRPALQMAAAAALAAAVCLPAGYWLGGAQGAAVAAAPASGGTGSESTAAVAPQRVEVVWDATQSSEPFADSDGQIVYAVQLSGVERRTWVDEQTGATIELTLSRERVQYVPAEVY